MKTVNSYFNNSNRYVETGKQELRNTRIQQKKPLTKFLACSNHELFSDFTVKESKKAICFMYTQIQTSTQWSSQSRGKNICNVKITLMWHPWTTSLIIVQRNNTYQIHLRNVPGSISLLIPLLDTRCMSKRGWIHTQFSLSSTHKKRMTSLLKQTVFICSNKPN